MNRYVLTEAEIRRLVQAAMDFAYSKANILNRRELAEANKAARSRPVPEGATHFSFIISGIEMLPVEEIPA